jgi:hypothetical protein
MGKIGRVLYQNKTSEPFLSGDLFAKKSDLSFHTNFRLTNDTFKQIRTSNVIFCQGDQLQNFLENFGKYLSKKVLIVGNSDRDWFDFPFLMAPGIKAVLLQNSFVLDGRITTLPIGIENFAHYRNGRPRNFSDKFARKDKSDQVLVGPFSPTHEVRGTLPERLKDSSRAKVIASKRLGPFSYADLASQFGYIACPRGNGEDTHRVWESLYRGSSPVLLGNEWSSSLECLHLPIATVPEWTNACIDGLQPFSRFDPKKFEALWWPFWQSKIKNLL